MHSPRVAAPCAMHSPQPPRPLLWSTCVLELLRTETLVCSLVPRTRRLPRICHLSARAARPPAQSSAVCLLGRELRLLLRRHVNGMTVQPPVIPPRLGVVITVLDLDDPYRGGGRRMGNPSCRPCIGALSAVWPASNAARSDGAVRSRQLCMTWRQHRVASCIFRAAAA